jgi:selenocysteine-specific elongation factor
MDLYDDVGIPDLSAELVRRGAATVALLDALGVPIPDPLPPDTVAVGKWLVSDRQWEHLRDELHNAIDSPSTKPVDLGVSHADVVLTLRMPDSQLRGPLVSACPELKDVHGRERKRGRQTTSRPDIEVAISQLTETLRSQPPAAPEQPQLVALGLGPRELRVAAAAGAILWLPGDIVLHPNATAEAVALLSDLPEQFTLSSARNALGTSRRVALPLLEHLDRMGHTSVWTETCADFADNQRRLPDGPSQASAARVSARTGASESELYTSPRRSC